MPAVSLLLVVTAALIHATWNLLAKREAAGGVAFVAAYNLFALIAYAPWAVTLIARGAVRPAPAVLGCLLASEIVHLLCSLSLQRGYARADLSVVYPVARGAGPALATIGAVLVLGERPAAAGVAGLLAVVVGIGVIASGGRLDAFRSSAASLGVRWGALTGALIATYTVVDGYGVKVLLIAPVVLDWCANALRFAMLAPVVLRAPGAARSDMVGRWSAAVGVGLLSPLSYILVLWALRLGAPLSTVAPAREMSMMAGALLGLLVLGEPVGRTRLAGCALLMGGVILLTAS